MRGWIILCLCLIGSGQAGWAYDSVDWPCFLGPSRNGVSSEKGWKSDWPDEGPPILWQASIGIGFSTFAVVGDRVWTMGSFDGKETILCLDANTGKEIWRQGYPARMCDTFHEGGPCATPSIDKDAVYTMGKDGKFYCLSAADGKIRWTHDLPAELGVEVSDFGISASPLVAGDQVITDCGVLAAYDKTTGKLLWKHTAVPRAFTSPTAFTLNGKEYGATLNGFGLLVFDPKTGEEGCPYKWETFDDTNCTTPILSGNRMFISSAYDRGGAVLEINWGKKPKVIWDNRNMRNHFSASVLWEGYLYGFDGNVNRDNQGELRCVSFADGELKWSEPSVTKGGLIISDGKILALTDKGELVVAHAAPDGFKEITRAQILGGRCWTPPVLSGGRLFCRNAVGDAVCFDLR